MKFNKWTLGLAAIGVVSLASAVNAEEKTANTVMTAVSSTTLSGYVDVSGQLNIGPKVNLPLYTVGGTKQQTISLNVVDIKLSKPLDESEWAAGYCVELWFGPDAVGLASTFDGNGDSSSAAIRQAYVALRTPIGNGIDWKIGVFDTIIGYESLTSGSNPNFTHSYGFGIEPTTHTGILGTYRINDMISIAGGIADTSYVFGNTAAINNGLTDPSWLASVALTAPESWGWIQGGTLYLGMIDTPSGGANTIIGDGGGANYYAGITMPTPLSTLKLGAAFDYLDIHNKSIVSQNKESIWTAGLYATFQATEKLSLNVRGEYFDSSDAGPFFGAPTPYPNNKAEALTLTAQYNLWANVISRLELRWDHVEHGRAFAANSGTPVANAYLLAAQLIYQF